MTIPDGLKHLAIIMDGNGRWAQEQGLTRMDGHTKGYEAFKNCVEWLLDYGINEVTFYAMSSENFSRPPCEVSHIMTLFLLASRDGLRMLHDKNVVVKIVGDTSKLSYAVRKAIDSLHARRVDNPTMQLNVCFSYGGHWHIESAFEQCREKGGGLVEFRKLLAHPFLQPMDFVIRTGGDHRISNFALWQLAYAELLFIDTYWPAFNKQILDDSLAVFALRKRRFGNVS